MKNLKSVSKPIYGLESLPNQIDVATLFEVKGGGDVAVCMGNKTIAVKCSGENTGVKCDSQATVDCSAENSGIICTSKALGDRPVEPKECLKVSDANKN